MYTLILGNNFIYESPKSVIIGNQILFTLGEDGNGPFLNTLLRDSNNNMILEVQNNKCIFFSHSFNIAKNNRDHILVKQNDGEIVLESRVLDKKTIMVAGNFYYQKTLLKVTQNYIVLPSGKWMMHNKAHASNEEVVITENGIEKSTSKF